MEKFLYYGKLCKKLEHNLFATFLFSSSHRPFNTLLDKTGKVEFNWILFFYCISCSSWRKWCPCSTKTAIQWNLVFQSCMLLETFDSSVKIKSICVSRWWLAHNVLNCESPVLLPSFKISMCKMWSFVTLFRPNVICFPFFIGLVFFYLFAHLSVSKWLTSHCSPLFSFPQYGYLLYLLFLFSHFLPLFPLLFFPLVHPTPNPITFSLDFFNHSFFSLSSLFSWPCLYPPAWLKQVISLLRPLPANPRRPPPSRSLRASQVMHGMLEMMTMSCWPWLRRTLILRWSWRLQIRWTTRCSDLL